MTVKSNNQKETFSITSGQVVWYRTIPKLLTRVATFLGQTSGVVRYFRSLPSWNKWRRYLIALFGTATSTATLHSSAADQIWQAWKTNDKTPEMKPSDG